MKRTYIVESRIRATDLASLAIHYEHTLATRHRSALVREAISDLVEILEANGRLTRRVTNLREAFDILDAKFGDTKKESDHESNHSSHREEGSERQ